MKNRSVSLLLPTLLALAPAVLPTLAHAADEPDDIDGGSSSKPDKKKAASDEVVREIVKGLYARANVGGAFYLGRFAGFVNGGTYTSLGLGQDFVDAEKVSLAWELSFAQGIHNGCYYEYQAQGQCTGNLNGKESPWIEGDLRTYTLAATIEASYYPTRRFGIGIAAGGGVLLSPLLMDETAYQEVVVQGSWGGNDGHFGDSPHPIVMGGPTFEYYTKLSHFSLGVDANVSYAVGFDLGANGSAYMKYTF